MKNNRKGFLGDIGLILAIIMIVSLMVIVGYKIFSSYNDKWQAAPSISNQSKTLVQDSKDRYVGLFDGIFMFVFALLIVGLFISASLINTRPEFFFIALVVAVFIIGGSAVISNSFETASDSQQLNNTSSEFTFIPFLMDNLPIITLLMVFVVMVALYVKMKGLV